MPSRSIDNCSFSNIGWIALSESQRASPKCNRILHLGTIAASGFLSFNSIAHVFDPPPTHRTLMGGRPRLPPKPGPLCVRGAADDERDPRQARGYRVQPDNSFNHAWSKIVAAPGGVFALSSALFRHPARRFLQWVARL